MSDESRSALATSRRRTVAQTAMARSNRPEGPRRPDARPPTSPLERGSPRAALSVGPTSADATPGRLTGPTARPNARRIRPRRSAESDDLEDSDQAMTGSDEIGSMGSDIDRKSHPVVLMVFSVSEAPDASPGTIGMVGAILPAAFHFLSVSTETPGPERGPPRFLLLSCSQESRPDRRLRRRS